MKFTFNVSPNLRQRQSTKRIMFELMLGLAAVYLFALVYYYTAYGMRYALQRCCCWLFLWAWRW